MTRRSGFAVSLRDADLTYGAVQFFGETVRFRTNKPFAVITRYFEKGVAKRTGTDRESLVRLRLAKQDLIPERVSWALVHVARLCGAEVLIPR